MPGTPATTPRLGLARYDNNVDPADFASQINAISDRLDLIVQMKDESLPIGGQAPYGGVGDPSGGKWLLCDGRALVVADYPELHGVIGFRYSPGGSDPGNGTFNIPDKRGRASVGADTMGTSRGAAGRLPNSNRTIGQNGGEERHAITAAETAVKGHGHTATSTATSTASSSASSSVSDPGHTHALTLRGAAGPVATWFAQGTQMSQALANDYAPDVETKTTGITVGTTVSTTVGTTVTTTVSTLADGANGLAHNNLQPYEVDNWIIRIR